MATDLHVWFADAAGHYAGELDAFGAKDDLPTLIANAAKNGQTVIDKTAPGAVRPPNAPIPPDTTKADYAAALTADAKVAVLAKRIGVI